MVAECLRKDVVNEILDGIRRDKLLPLPGGIVKDILAERITLKDATPWVMGVKVHELKSKDEIWLSARVRFVSDEGAGVELLVLTVGGIKLPVNVENISVELHIQARVHLMDELPFVRIVWISLLEEPKIDLSIRSLAMDIMSIPGLDTIIQELIMTAIKNEVVVPMGKTAPVFMANPDLARTKKDLEEFYKEPGSGADSLDKEPGRLEEFAGVISLYLVESRAVLHPVSAGLCKDVAYEVYMSVSCGNFTFRTARIQQSAREVLNERFEIPVSKRKGEIVVLELVCRRADFRPDKVPMVSIPVEQLLSDKFAAPVWVDTDEDGARAGLTNAALLVRSRFRAFERPYKTVELQRSPSHEIVGGRGVRAEEAGGPPGPCSPAGGPEAGDVEEAAGSSWDRVVLRRRVRGVLWVQLHAATGLKSKLLQTRDPYVKLQVGGYEERSTAKSNTREPVWEEVYGLAVRDPLNDSLQVTVLQNDVAQGRHVTDDAIGTASLPVREVAAAWVKDRRLALGAGLGEVRLSLRLQELPDAITEGKRLGARYASKCTGGLAPDIPVSSGVTEGPAGSMRSAGILQLRVLEGRNMTPRVAPEGGGRPDVYLVVTLVDDQGKGRSEPAETRPVPAGERVEWSEYTEVMVGADPGAESVRVQLKSSGTFLKRLWNHEVMASAQVPVSEIARGAATADGDGAAGRWLLLAEGKEAVGAPVFVNGAAAAAKSGRPAVLVDWRLALFEPRGEDAKRFLGRLGAGQAQAAATADGDEGASLGEAGALGAGVGAVESAATA